MASCNCQCFDRFSKEREFVENLPGIYGENLRREPFDSKASNVIVQEFVNFNCAHWRAQMESTLQVSEVSRGEERCASEVVTASV